MNAVPSREAELDVSFELFGSTARLLIGAPRSAVTPPPELAAPGVERFLRGVHTSLTRFEPESELSRMNADPADAVEVSALVAAFVGAALAAAERSAGLVDPTVLGALEGCGYARSRAGATPSPLAEAIAWAPARRPALPSEGRPWRSVLVEGDRTVRRPPGLRLDSGGIAKGLAADICAARLAGYSSFAVDCGGDLRIGGADRLERSVEVTDPFTDEVIASFGLEVGAVATSGLSRRVWETPDGGFAHHLIDPARGVPAWTGLIQVTAVAPTAVEAETLAKAALLSGPEGAGRWLARWGGVAFDDNGCPHVFGALRNRLRPLAEIR